MKASYFLQPEKLRLLDVVKSYLLYVGLVLPIPVCGILYIFLEENLDLTKLYYNAAFLAQITVLVVKLYPSLYNNGGIRQCITCCDSAFLGRLTRAEAAIVGACVRTCSRNTLVFLVCSVLGTVGWATKPLFASERSFPVDVWTPFPASDDVWVYAAVYGFLVIAVAFTALADVIIDPLVAGLIYQAACQIRVLKSRLQNVHLERKEVVYEKISLCAQHHNAILEFTSSIEKCFSPMVFSQFAASILVIGFCCLQLSQVNSTELYFFQLIVYLVVILAQIFYYCYYGSVLYHESNSIIKAISVSKWYDCDIVSQKALLIIMEKASQPISITAGKLISLSLETFATILRRSYSLLAVLNTYQ